MANFFKRFVNLLAVLGTLLGIILLMLPDYNYRFECIVGMAIGYGFIAGINYLLFNKLTVWNKQL